MLYNLLDQFRLKTLLLTIILVLISTVFLVNHTIVNNDLLIQSMGDQIPIEQINSLLEAKSHYEWVNYLLLVGFAFLKYLIIAGIIDAGLLLSSIDVKFSKILKLVIIAEFVFFIPIIIKILWFSFIVQSYDLKDLSFFSPLSVLNFFAVNSIGQAWVYPLSLINIFELTYIGVLAFGIKQLISTSFDNALKIIVSSYLPALFVWVLFIAFLTIMANPA